MIFGFWEGFPRRGKVLSFKAGWGEKKRQEKLGYFIALVVPSADKVIVSFWSSIRKAWHKSVAS